MIRPSDLRGTLSLPLRLCGIAARGRSHYLSETQAKPPAPPLPCNNLQILVGQAFSLPDFCHGLLRRYNHLGPLRSIE